MDSIVCHIDVNSAFLSWTAAYRVKMLGERQDLRDIPSAICGNSDTRHGIILAKSGPARQYGVKTGEPLYQARQKCPRLTVAPPDYALYTAASRQFVALLKEMAPVVEQYSIDEAWIDIGGTEKLYGPPARAAELIKNRIRDELGFTVNVGVSSNKLLAKMASDFEKPDRVHTLFPAEMPDKLWPLPVRNLFMVGPATERKLAAIGIRTIGQLAKADPERLKLRLHQYGGLIWNFANGRCPDAVRDEAALNKGYGNSVTTPADVTDRGLACRVLLSLAENIGFRIRKDGQAGSCVTVFFRTADFANFSRQQQLPDPTDATLEIYRAACRLFDRLWDGRTPLRQLGVYLSRTGCRSGRQAALFEDDRYDQLVRADQAVDGIRARFGERAILRACLLQPGTTALNDALGQERHYSLTKPLPGP